MTLHEALDKCNICDIFNKNISDKHKMQVIDKLMSAPNTKVPKVKLSCIIAWLLKKVEWQGKRIEELEEDIQNLEGIKLAQETALSTEYIIEEQLQKENAELKDDNKVMADNYSKMEQKFYISLTEAKAIIKDYMIVASGIEACSVPEENRCINVLKLNEQAEQFLKEE